MCQPALLVLVPSLWSFSVPPFPSSSTSAEFKVLGRGDQGHPGIPSMGSLYSWDNFYPNHLPLLFWRLFRQRPAPGILVSTRSTCPGEEQGHACHPLLSTLGLHSPPMSFLRPPSTRHAISSPSPQLCLLHSSTGSPERTEGRRSSYYTTTDTAVTSDRLIRLASPFVWFGDVVLFVEIVSLCNSDQPR